VFFFVITRGSDAAVEPLLLPVLLPLLLEAARRVDVVVRRAGAEVAGADGDRMLLAGVTVAFVRSAAEMESSLAFGFACAASDRSLFSAGSAGLSLLHPVAIARAGARMSILMKTRMKPPVGIGSRRLLGVAS
jgi:hypothetical protein